MTSLFQSLGLALIWFMLVALGIVATNFSNELVCGTFQIIWDKCFPGSSKEQHIIDLTGLVECLDGDGKLYLSNPQQRLLMGLKALPY